MVDGTVSYIEPDGSVAEPFISIECKNYSIGVNTSLLKEIFGQIKPGIRCSHIFVSSFEGQVWNSGPEELRRSETLRREQRKSDVV